MYLDFANLETNLSTLLVDLLNGLYGVQVVDTRVKANLVHDNDTSILGSLVKLTYGWRDVASSDDVGLTLDSGLDNSSVVGIRDQRDDEVMGSDGGLESLGVVHIEGDGTGARKVGSESLS